MWASLAAIPIKSVYKDYKSLKKMKKEKAMLRAKYMKSDGATLKTRGDVRSAAQLSFQSLYKSALVAVTDYRCRACRGGPAAEERADSHNIVILRHGVFSKHLGRHKVTADVNQAVFFSKDLPYRVSHPADCGDRGTVFIVSEPELINIIREFDPDIDEYSEQPFPFAAGPCSTITFRRQRELVRRLEFAGRSDFVDGLCIDETALTIVSDVLSAAYERLSLPQKSVRRATTIDHAERVEAAKQYLACHIGEHVTLDGLARSVHVSPFHLSRIFQYRTGITLHRYLMRLRLRQAFERLADGEQDLTMLALDLGFSSHSHFTDAFRREFGCAPSAVRRLNAKAIREMSKNMEA